METTVLERFDALKHMNAIMLDMNNEFAYLNWVEVVPDEASDEDLMFIAEDKQRYKEVEDLFFKICKKYGSDGMYLG